MVRKHDLFFLLYFVPLFFVKLLTFDASSNILKTVAVICFGLFALQIMMEKKYQKKELMIWVIFGAYLALLVLTCGKEGALFSLIAIISMRKTRIIRNQSILFYIGILGVLLCLYMTSDTREAIRYVGGAWVSITKRSNIAFISFFAVVNIYLMTFKKNSLKTIGVVGILSYLVFKYTGCRTGMGCAIILLFLLFFYRYRWFQKSRVVKFFSCVTPTICFVISIALVYVYNSGNKIGILLNSVLQGRLRQGSMFLDTYNPKLFGQKLAENFSSSNFFVLDSAYLDMYLCYGVIFSVLWVALTTYVIYWAYKKNNYIGVAIIVSYAVFGIAETFLPNCFLNPSLLLYGECVLEKLGVQKIISEPIRLFRIKRHGSKRIRA